MALTAGVVQTYNSLKTIDEQSQSIDAAALDQLAILFERHQQQLRFGVCLVHRHGFLSEGCAMVHSFDTSTDVCKMESVTERPLFGHSFYIGHEAGMRAYEYSSTPLPLPPPSFVADLRKILVENNLQDTLGLCSAPPSDDIFIEFVARDGNGTVAKPAQHVAPILEDDSVTTQWGFFMEGNELKVKALRKCVRPEGGGHKIEDIS